MDDEAEELKNQLKPANITASVADIECPHLKDIHGDSNDIVKHSSLFSPEANIHYDAKLFLSPKIDQIGKEVEKEFVSAGLGESVNK